MDARQLLDLYDTHPNVIKLIGGPYDGQQLTVPGTSWPQRWLMPRMPAPTVTFTAETDPSLRYPSSHPAYAYTDSLDDNGIRAYRYVGDL